MRLVSSSPTKFASGTATAFFVGMMFTILVMPLVGQQRLPPGSKDLAEPNDLLMLVREWDTSTGALTGWLPSHSVAIKLGLLHGLKPMPHFKPDEAVYIKMPRYPRGTSSDLKISREPRMFEGQFWVPVQHDPNLVRIHEQEFLVRDIIFNGGKWRHSTKFPATSNGREKPAAQNDISSQGQSLR